MSVSWLKQGEASAAAAKQEAVEQQTRKEEQGKMFRFFIKQGEKCQITFIDGALNKDGVLNPPRYYEHNLQLNGKWGNTFVCPEQTAPHLKEKCPICATGDRPALISLFTVIDHREFVSQKGTKYKDTQKIFAAKPGTMEILNTIAIKRGGLAGCTFDVTRTGEKSPSVGTMFDFDSKELDLAVLRAKYMREIVDPKTNAKSMKTAFAAADYESEIVFKTGEQLAAMGFGIASVSGYGGGYQEQASGGAAQGTNYADQM
jgi:hypothetical protein